MQTVIDPPTLATLTASLHASALIAMVVGTVGLLITALLVYYAFRADSSESELAVIFAILIGLSSIGIIAGYYDEVVAPQYEAQKQLHNKQIEGHKLP